MGDRQLHLDDTESLRPREGPARKLQARLTAGIAADRDLAKRDAPPSGAEGLHRGLFRGEPAGDVLGESAGMAARPVDLALHEDACQKSLAEPFERGRDARNGSEVEAEKDRHDPGLCPDAQEPRDPVGEGSTVFRRDRLGAPGVEETRRDELPEKRGRDGLAPQPEGHVEEQVV